MQFKIDQLASALQKGLAPIYFLSGDEPLQLGECADTIRKTARGLGYETREVFSTDTTGFDWNQINQSADALSIFSDKKIIDLRIPNGTVGNEGAKALTRYCERLPEDTLLLITTTKVTKETLKNRWLTAIDKVGVIVQVWALDGDDLVRWLQQRMQKRGITTDMEGVKWLASRIEGNLLAAAQEIEKLYVLYGNGHLTSQQLVDVVADSSRYDVFKLMDSILNGQMNRLFKILQGLQAEGTAAPVILWAITREARALIKIKMALARGENRETVFRNHQIWDKRKQLVATALQRLNESDLNMILVLSAKADRQIKGQQAGDAWETLLNICLCFASNAQKNPLHFS